MKARVAIPQLKSERSAHTVIRNLSRILDIRVIDMDIENGYLTFIYETKLAYNQVKHELMRIGYPMKAPNSANVWTDIEIPQYDESNKFLSI